MPDKWEIVLRVPFREVYKDVRVYTYDGRSFEIRVSGEGREGSIGWMRVGWRFHTHRNTSLTTADFIVLADMLEEVSPFKFDVEWLPLLGPNARWRRPPFTQIHWALICIRSGRRLGTGDHSSEIKMNYLCDR